MIILDVENKVSFFELQNLKRNCANIFEPPTHKMFLSPYLSSQVFWPSKFKVDKFDFSIEKIAIKPPFKYASEELIVPH